VPAQRIEPRAVPLPDLTKHLGSGWTLAAQGNLGELVLASLTGGGTLDMASPRILSLATWTNAAAEGTSGDAYALYLNGERSVTVLGTLWRTAKDAAEFQDGLKAVPRNRSFRAGNAVVILAGAALGEAGVTIATEALSAIASTAAETGSTF
jgi:hypothetical protein